VLAEVAAACGPVPLLWKWPRITTRRYLDEAVPLLASAPVAGVLVDGLGAARAVARAVPGLPVHGGPGLNLWNSRAVGRIADAFASLTLSPELDQTELADAVAGSRSAGVAIPIAVMVEGNLELMVTDDCLSALDSCPASTRERYALEDERRRRFPVVLDGECRTRILNAVETCLINHLPAVLGAGVDLLVVDARDRGPAWAAAAITAYRGGVAALDAPDAARHLAALKEGLRSRSAGGITAGPFAVGRHEEGQLLPGSEHDTACHRSSS
jgi:putative protease